MIILLVQHVSKTISSGLNNVILPALKDHLKITTIFNVQIAWCSVKRVTIILNVCPVMNRHC